MRTKRQAALIWRCLAANPARAVAVGLGAGAFEAVLLGLGAFHVAGGMIHLLLIVAAISLIVHFVRGRGATV